MAALMDQDKYSIDKTKRYGEMGSLCLKLLLHLECPCNLPLSEMEKDVVLIQSLIQAIIMFGKPSLGRIFKRKSQEIVSKAFSISTIIILLGDHVFLPYLLMSCCAS